MMVVVQEPEDIARDYMYFFEKYSGVLCFNQMMLLFQGKRAANEQKVQEVKRLAELDVDVNEYVLSQHRLPERTVKIVSAEGAANLHLHRN